MHTILCCINWLQKQISHLSAGVFLDWVWWEWRYVQPWASALSHCHIQQTHHCIHNIWYKYCRSWGGTLQCWNTWITLTHWSLPVHDNMSGTVQNFSFGHLGINYLSKHLNKSYIFAFFRWISVSEVSVIYYLCFWTIKYAFWVMSPLSYKKQEAPCQTTKHNPSLS